MSNGVWFKKKTLHLLHTATLVQIPFHMRCTSITCYHYTGQWLLRGTYLSSMSLAEAYVVSEEDFAVTAETPVQIQFQLRCNSTLC